MEIKKINELKNVESFLQINFEKGFKFLDKTGEIINIFNKVPLYENTGALLIKKTEREEIRINHFYCWSHFLLPDSLGQISDNFTNDVEKILKIIEIKEISRIGWRNYFIYAFDKTEKSKNVLNKFTQKNNLNFNAVAFSYKENEINFNFRIEKLTNPNNGNDELLIDVDLFKNFNKDKLLQLSGQKNILREIREKIQSDSFLDMINFILTEKNV